MDFFKSSGPDCFTLIVFLLVCFLSLLRSAMECGGLLLLHFLAMLTIS